jgi:hypothetical protein
MHRQKCVWWEVTIYHETTQDSRICLQIKWVFFCDQQSFKDCAMKTVSKSEKACVFIDLCVYYWLWINWFIIILSSIYDLFKKNIAFLWMSKQQQIMNKLKILLLTELIIQQLDYDSDTEDIILIVNLSKKE